VIKLRCEDFDELIHLFWDERIDERKKEELEKHLSACKRCKEKLALLESIEKKAKGIKIKEPSCEYWDTFSSRVRERILAQKEGSFSFKLKKAFENIFTFSPLKIKVAAGVVSIVLVFIVGKLYVDYRGREIIPTTPRIESRKKPALYAPEVTKEISAPEEKAKREEEAAPPPDKMEETVSPEITREEKTAPVTPLEQEIKKKKEFAPPTKETEKAQAFRDLAKEETKAEVVEPEERLLSPETYTTGAGAEKQGKVLQEMVPPERKAKEERSVPSKGLTKTEKREPSPLALSHAKKTPLVKNYYVLDEEQIPKIEEEDTLLQEGVLRETIESWNRYIEKNPKDSLTNEGYLQVAISYYLLSKLTQDESDLLEGIELLEKYKNQATDPKTKEELNKKLKQLKALKEK